MPKVCCLILVETEPKVRPDVRHPLVSHGSVSAVEQPLNPSLLETTQVHTQKH